MFIDEDMMKQMYFFRLLLTLWTINSYSINQSDVFNLQRDLQLLTNMSNDISLSDTEQPDVNSNDALIRDITNYFTYPFIKNVNKDQESALASLAIKTKQEDLYKDISTEVVAAFPTTLQTKLSGTIQTIRAELHKLAKNESLKNDISKILSDIELALFHNTQEIESNYLLNIFSQYIERIDKVLRRSEAHNVVQGLLKSSLEQLKRDFASNISVKAREQFIEESTKVALERTNFIKIHIDERYQSFFEQTLRTFALSNFDSQKDMQRYYQLKELISLLPQSSHESASKLIDSILSIRETMMQSIEVMMHIQGSILQTKLDPQFKAQLERLINTKIANLLAVTKVKVQQLPEGTTVPLKAINWDGIKDDWLNSITNAINSALKITPIIAPKAENFLNMIFTLYLTPQVIASKTALPIFTERAKEEAKVVIKEELNSYKESAISKKQTLSETQKIEIYTRYRKYKSLRDVLLETKSSNQPASNTALKQVLDISRGGDLDEAEWDNRDLKALKALNAYIVQNFDPIQNIFKSDSKKTFNQLFDEYTNSSNRRIKSQYEESFKQWSAVINAS